MFRRSAVMKMGSDLPHQPPWRRLVSSALLNRRVSINRLENSMFSMVAPSRTQMPTPRLELRITQLDTVILRMSPWVSVPILMAESWDCRVQLVTVIFSQAP
ncbi:hypothetical protein D3C75_951860 [compost metagenome]